MLHVLKAHAYTTQSTGLSCSNHHAPHSKHMLMWQLTLLPCPWPAGPALVRAPTRLCWCRNPCPCHEQMRLVRGVTGKQFSEALDESLRPVMT